MDVGGSTANAKTDDTDDEDLIGYDSISPALPPASSDRRKWWLDNGKSTQTFTPSMSNCAGLPARSNVKGPSETQVPNPQQPSNPFIPTSEPDYIENPKVPPPVPASRQIKKTVAARATKSPAQTTPRKQLPPSYERHNESVASLPSNPKSVPSGQMDGASSFNPTSSTVSLQGSTSQHTLRKAGPPIPKKPVLLRSPSSQSSSFTIDTKDHTTTRVTPKASTVNMEFPPPPRRTSTIQTRQSLYNHSTPLATRPKSLQRPRPTSDDGGPPLPSRSSESTTQRKPNLLDEGDDAFQSMSAWQALRPQ